MLGDRLWSLSKGAAGKIYVYAPLHSLDHAGGTLVTGLHDATVKLWDIGGEKAIRKLGAHGEAAVGVQFLGNGARVLSASMNGTACVWEGEELELALPEYAVRWKYLEVEVCRQRGGPQYGAQVKTGRQQQAPGSRAAPVSFGRMPRKTLATGCSSAARARRTLAVHRNHRHEKC